MASDPDGGSFSYELLGQPAYGSVSLDAAGNWSYVGRRPQGVLISDLDGDGVREWVDPDYGGRVYPGSYPGNMDSNTYIPDEPAPFLDYFTVRVYDSSDPGRNTFRDVEIPATHYGPPPNPEIANSGGGGKKPIAIDLDGNGFHFTDVDDSNVFFDVNRSEERRVGKECRL